MIDLIETISKLENSIQRGVDIGMDMCCFLSENALSKAMKDHDTKTVVWLLAAGARFSSRGHLKLLLSDPYSRDAYPRELLNALLVTHSNLEIGNLPWAKTLYVQPSNRELVQADVHITKVQVELVIKRAFQVCTGLYSLRLDALQMCEILMYSCGKIGIGIPLHIWWKIATKIKHFHPRKQ